MYNEGPYTLHHIEGPGRHRSTGNYEACIWDESCRQFIVMKVLPSIDVRVDEKRTFEITIVEREGHANV